ncbi:methyltransferase domain-containing protein [Methylobacterium sp. 092160098-2]|uniref:class I SAM-dependent methyltransferase n=1 Tax=Methylobacterium sp. 092160098-2 TaxID=3025129 RepID=UPI002381C2FB|nr:methyltransferase domain-containing protein [Methylobacterium sp. 092160098-2]MDE4912798.1 methyltransferase domain-containing protein [Methylobacterium sp. 092160098-2]
MTDAPAKLWSTELVPSADLDQFFTDGDPWGYESHPDDHRRAGHILSAISSLSFARILDIGCGDGYLTLRLPPGEIIGVDISPAAVEWATRKAGLIGRDDVRFEVCNVFDLDGSDLGDFDLVIVTGVLYKQYIGHAFSVASDRILRLLRPGGHLIHVHIESWFSHAFPLTRVAKRTYPYRDYIHLLEVYRR